MLRIIVALGLLYFVFFGGLPEINIGPIIPVQNEVDEVQSLLDIQKPSDTIISQVKPVADLVTSIEDRAKLALFNYEFSSRVEKYNTDTQQLNDVYTKAAAGFFKEELKGKYSGLSEGLVGILKSVTTDDNHVLTMDEKSRLKDLFTGLSWTLIEK